MGYILQCKAHTRKQKKSVVESEDVFSCLFTLQNEYIWRLLSYNETLMMKGALRNWTAIFFSW